jgi:hypothetical protein
MPRSNRVRDRQIRTDEWPMQAPTEYPAGAAFLLPFQAIVNRLAAGASFHVAAPGQNSGSQRRDPKEHDHQRSAISSAHGNSVPLLARAAETEHGLLASPLAATRLHSRDSTASVGKRQRARPLAHQQVPETGTSCPGLVKQDVERSWAARSRVASPPGRVCK